MKIFLICSKRFYPDLPPVRKALERAGHTVTLPNSYDAPETESRLRGTPEHAAWKAKMIRRSEAVIGESDAVLVVNNEKDDAKGYVGGATFLEIYDAFRLGKKIFFLNPLPEGMLRDELIGFSPVILNGDLSKVTDPTLS